MKKKNARLEKGHPASSGASNRGAIVAMLFLSGFAGLVYQVLWMRQLGLLFGNTAHAASATLAAFFAGLAAGSGYWGKRTSLSSQPLRLYAHLQAGIALTALLYFIILKVFYGIYPVVHESAVGMAPMMLVKFVLALLLIFPPAFCMGGTLPAVVQHLIRKPGTFGRTSALLYGINTLGAASGVVCAAFLLIPLLGFRLTYTVAILLSAGIGATAWRLHGRSGAAETGSDLTARLPDHPKRKNRTEKQGEPAGRSRRFLPGNVAVQALCFLSGFAVLALEVLWTRLFAQVHENSVYAFAVILTVVLVCLALGAWLSARLARINRPPLLTLGVLTLIGGGVLAFGPRLFMAVTHNLRTFSSIESWGRYVMRLFAVGFGGIGVVVLALGTVFPFLMKAAEHETIKPGRTLGRLLALNTAGAIAGSLVCGFVLLPSLGMWRTMRLITAGYLIVGLLIPYGWSRATAALRTAGLTLLVLLFTVLDPSDLPTQAVHPAASPRKVLETWEGGDCTVAVLEDRNGERSIKINSNYALGSSDAYSEQVDQSRIPLYIYPDTESIFYIGLGTGISAGASLDSRFPNVKRIVACELVPEVVEAAKKYMPEKLTGGVFSDPRSTVLIADGRHHLMVSDEKYDMINADLFLPYRRGAGSLYSLEHYRVAAERLTPDGVFVQWLPLYQITGYEFGIIVRTMLEAFEQVTMWRNNFVPGNEKVALIGQRRASPIASPPPENAEDMLKAVEGLTLIQARPEMAIPNRTTITFFYCGNVSAARDFFHDYPINTDDRPLIEYVTPRAFRKNAGQKIIWFVGPKIADMTDKLLDNCPVDRDPLLANCSAAKRRLVLAGAAFHRAMVWKVMGQFEAAQKEWRKFKTAWRQGAE